MVVENQNLRSTDVYATFEYGKMSVNVIAKTLLIFADELTSF